MVEDDVGVLSTESILGSTKGIRRLAAFIEISKAFDKPPAPRLEPY
jgi:hypothetical protein